MKEKSKRACSRVSKCIRLQVDVFLSDPAEEYILWPFVELDLQYGMVAADIAPDHYSVLQ